MEKNEPKYTLKEFTNDELNTFNKDLQVFLDNRSAHMVARASLKEDGTIGASLIAFKKVELIPKGEGFQINGQGTSENNNAKPEEKPEGK